MKYAFVCTCPQLHRHGSGYAMRRSEVGKGETFFLRPTKGALASRGLSLNTIHLAR